MGTHAVAGRDGESSGSSRFPEARRPAWKVWADFGPYGEKKTSARIAALYAADDLIGRQIVGVINFPPKQIGPFRSEFLLTGFPTDAGVVLTAIERLVPDGTRLALSLGIRAT